MTQTQLAEKLFVSDKTVSRWERDESTPDLALIPIIADLFGVTTDELLRGERRARTEALTVADEQKESEEKKGKRYSLLLKKRLKKYKYLSFISIGCIVLGFLFAFILNFFHQGLIGFIVGLAFLVGACICQICFLGTTTVQAETDDEETALFNRSVQFYAKNIFVGLIATLGFLCPLLLCRFFGFGLQIPYWLMYGTPVALFLLLLSYILFEAFIREKLYKTESESVVIARRKKLLKKCLLSFAIGTVVFGAAFITVYSMSYRPFAKKKMFNDYQSFQEYMAIENYGSSKTWGYPFEHLGNDRFRLLDEEGNELMQFDWKNGDIYDLEISKAKDRLPIVVYTNEVLENAIETKGNIQIAVLIVYGVFVLSLFVVYSFKNRKNKL